MVEVDKNGRQVKRKPRNDLGVSDEEIVEALLRNPATYEFADLIPDADPSAGGRPRIYPKYLYFVVACLADTKRSVRSITNAMKGKRFWAHMQEVVVEMFPENPEMHLPDRSPDRTWFGKTRDRNGLGEVLQDFRQHLTTTGIETATDIGLPLTEEGLPWEATPNRMVAIDGKVIKSPTQYAKGDTRTLRLVDTETGEISTEERQRRHDPDAKFHMQGDKRRVRGNKFVAGWARGDGEYQSVVLFVDHVPDEKGKHNSEGDIMMKNLDAIAPLLPGLVGPITDGVSRGKYLDRMQREHGWNPVAPVAAAKVDKETGERLEEKEGFLKQHRFDGCTRGAIEIWYQAGWVTKAFFDETGDKQLERLEWLRAIRRKDANSYRTYVEYRATCNCGEHTEVIRERTYYNDEDVAKNFNRAETYD